MRTQKIIGAILCAIGMVFASGDTISNGIVACLFMTVGYLALRYGASERKQEQKQEQKIHYRNAA